MENVPPCTPLNSILFQPAQKEKMNPRKIRQERSQNKEGFKYQVRVSNCRGVYWVGLWVTRELGWMRAWFCSILSAVVHIVRPSISVRPYIHHIELVKLRPMYSYYVHLLVCHTSFRFLLRNIEVKNHVLAFSFQNDTSESDMIWSGAYGSCSKLFCLS